MTTSWVVPFIGTDFQDDIEDIVIEHLYNQWSIAEPAKPAAMVAADAPIQFRPGFLNYTVPYEVTALQTVTRPQKKTNMHYLFMTDVPITLRAKRLTTDTDPTKPLEILSAMEAEIERIALTYRPNDFPGLDGLFYGDSDRVYNPEDTFSKSEWSAVVRLVAFYQKTAI